MGITKQKAIAEGHFDNVCPEEDNQPVFKGRDVKELVQINVREVERINYIFNTISGL